MWIHFVLALVLIAADPSEAVYEQVMTHELAEYLLTNYSAQLLPQCALDSPVVLTVDVALRQVMELNEREQLLTTNVWMRLKWNDCRLQWNPADFDNITYVTVTYDDVWIPDITIYDSAAEEIMMPGKDEYRAYISSAGIVFYNFPTVLKTVCRVNVRHFPWDTQRCQLKFGSWCHHGLELDVTNKNAEGDLDVYIANNEWDIEDLPVVRSVLYYNCCPEPYPDVTYYIVMRRRPIFYILTMLFPCMLTSAVAAIGFMLPAESGEKVSLNITVLLSMAVFLLVVSESMPPSSDNFPIVGIYFAVSMSLVSGSCLLTVLILNVFYRGENGRRVPRIIKLVFFKYLAKVFCARHNKVEDMKIETNIHPRTDSECGLLGKTSKHGPLEQVSSALALAADGKPPQNENLAAVIGEQTKYFKRVNDVVYETQMTDSVKSEWRDVANILDRVFLSIYVFVSLVATLSLFAGAVGQ